MDENIPFRLGQLDQFKSDICGRVDRLEVSMTKKLSIIESKVDKNRTWRVKTIAFSSGISAVVTFIAGLITFFATVGPKIK